MFIVIPHKTSVAYNKHKPMVILNKDFVPEMAYLYN